MKKDKILKAFIKHLIVTGALCSTASGVLAMDLTNGVMSAVPVKGGQAPTIDGDLKDFDLSATEPMWISPQTIGTLRANVALMYDEDALYLGAQVSLPNRPLRNPNNPTDAFWNGDVLELRLAADPSLPAPLNGQVNSDRVAHLTMWKNSDTGADFLNITYGVNLEKGSKVNPAGSQIVIKTHGEEYYTIEARMPWSAFNVPGGKNPFAAGQKMTAVLSPHWGGETQVAALYRSNPGMFAFMQPQTWGQVEFSPTGNLKPRHETLAQLVARFAAESKKKPVAVGVPLIVNVPAAMKVSVNIFGPKGEVVRELMGGEMQPKGKLTLRWDGKDQWGKGVKPGSYRWGAYFSKGLKAQYVGGVGKSGSPYYETEDGKGGWGADHSPPLDVAADASGLYFLWPVSEAGRAVVKTDYAGKVLWRKTPFIGGGFGPTYAIASDGRYIYAIHETDNIYLYRMDAATGQLTPYGESATVLIGKGNSIAVPRDSTPVLNNFNNQPESVGIAASTREIFVPIYSQNIIRVLDPATGAMVREISCPSPRGLSLDARGDLYAVSYAAGKSQIVKFSGAKGAAQVVVQSDLDAPWDVAAGSDGRIFVSDMGKSQQVKAFDANGKLLQSIGKSGGRAWQGTYDNKAFLHPAGLALDTRGGLLVAESSIPKVFSRLDAKTGAVQKQWFGSPSYWASTWPSVDNPRVVFAPTHGGIAQFTLPEVGDQDRPDAYWALNEAGYANVSNFETNMPQPEWVKAKNGHDYLVSDGNQHTITLKEGDKLRPIAQFRGVRAGSDENKTGPNFIEVWIDQNGDGQITAAEITRLDTVQGKPIPMIGDLTDSMHMEPNGDLYFMTQGNSILKVPGGTQDKNGALRWNTAAAHYAVPSVLPSKPNGIETTWRHGLHGARIDSKGDLYNIFNTTVGGSGAPFEYATPEMATRMKEGMGHTSTFNVVKFAKFNPKGELLWMAGRKATAAANAGEMFHFWNMAGLVNDKYIAGASEWGQIYFYTSDGFFVDALMENPGLNPAPGPANFGGETSGGRVQYFPKQDELWAYSTGKAFQVAGFKGGKVVGEQRASGTVNLDRVYEAAATTAHAAAPPLQIVPLTGDVFADANVWNVAPVSTLSRDGSTLATTQIGYNAQFLYGRIRVNDASPLQNAADTITTAFKGGDTAGFVLGPIGKRQQPGAGDVRFMVAQIGGKARLIAMKAIANGQKRPESYITPAAGEARFEFVGEVPGGRAVLIPDATGYTAIFAVPRSFLEFDLAAGGVLQGDIEVRLSGNGPRGVQVTSRNYLFTPSTTATTMTDDVPTEARLYPEGWGKVEIK